MRVVLGVCLALPLLVAGCMGGDDESRRTVTVLEASAESSPAGDGAFDRIPEIVDRVRPSVVAVRRENGEGSGVIWSADGLIVTNNHVVEGTNEVEIVFASNDSVRGRVLATDPLFDLALIEVDRAQLPAATFARNLPDVGELAVAIGNPLGFENSVTAGIVSGLHRDIPSGGRTPALVDLLQTDAAISPGNSGGALVDADGNIIGINVAYIPPQARAVSLGFAIPAATAVDVLEQLAEDGQAEHAFLGVQPAELTPAIAEQFGLDVPRGVLVQSVVEGSAAAEAGVRAGDVIVAIDGEELEQVENLFAALRRKSPGDNVTLEIVRDGERMEVEATLTDRPE
jgi:serine protease DegQ